TGLAGESQAEVVVRTPFVLVRIGKPHPPGPGDVVVRTPFVGVRVTRPAHVPACPAPTAPPTQPVEPGAPPPVPVDPPAEVSPAPRPADLPATVRALTVREFASSFRPRAGEHEVLLLHPLTGKPVKVGFTLPPGTPRKVRVTRRALTLDYGRRDVVVIRFFRDGTVRVRY